MLAEPGPEQRAIRDAVQRYLAQEADILDRMRDPARAAGDAARRWADFARLGWLGLPLPDAHGGSGGGMAELWPVLTGLGHGLSLDPYLPTVVLGGLTIARAGNAAQQARLLPRIVAGELRVALAGMAGGDTTRARRTAGGWRIDGHKGVVLGAPEAGLLILGTRSASTQAEPLLLLVDPRAAGVTLRAYPLIDGRMAAEVHLDDVDVATDAVLAEGEAAATAMEDASLAGALACVAEAVGAMEAALERTIAHLRHRQQFGARLADQQALRHRVADMFIACQESAALGWRAALAFDERHAEMRRMAVAAAMAHAGPAALRVCEEAIQLHGAIAITDEIPVGHYLKRAVVAERLFGNADHWLGVFCAAGEALTAP